MRKILLLLISSLFYISGAFAQQDTSKSAKDTLPKTDTIRYTPGAKVQITKDTITLSEDPGNNSSGSGIKGSKPSTGTASRASAGASDLGRTMGSLDVSPSGAATYTVPIAVPAGINGVVPQVTLSYNSQGGNGLAGYGWNVGGVSAITRIPATQFHDGRVGSVNIDADDRYALDGQRLILKSGTYGADGAEYQTENYTNLKIISHGNSGYGSNYFEVDYPDGSVANYGYSGDSKTSTDWALSYTDNPQDVRINYSYLQDNNTIAISQISYGATGTATALNQVNFVYKDRQRNEQVYIAGTNIFRTKILSGINVVGNGTVYRNYSLVHNIVSTLNYERLISITEQSGNQAKSFEPVNFEYSNTGDIIVHSGVSNLSVGGISEANADVITSDFTGDGTMDFILYPKAKNKIWAFWDPNSNTPYTQFGYEVNTGTFEDIFPVTWLTQNNKLLSGQGFVLVKYDSDYNIRFEVKSAGTVAPVYAQYDKIWNANYQYYSACDGYKNGKIPRQFISGDFNGDGLTDVIAVNRPYSQINSEPRSGNTCYPQYSDVTYSAVHFINLDRRIGSNFTQVVGYLSKSFTGSDRLYSADMNGDGKTDIVHLSSGVMYVYGMDENNNLNLLWQQTNDTRITLNYPALFGDYNGDGKTDVLFPTSSTAPQSRLYAAFLSTGKGFQKYEQNFPFNYQADSYSAGNLSTRRYIPNDINGDGKTDMILFQAQTKDGSKQGSISLTVYNNYGSATAQSAPNFISTRSVSRTTTLIHYPIPVFLTSEKPNYGLELAAMSDNSLSWFKFQKDLKTDALLTSVNQDGLTHSVDYKNLQHDPLSSDLQIYESSYNQTFPNIDIQLAPGLNVVSSVRRSYNNSEIKQIFGYRGAVSNTDGLGFLGFSEVIRSNWHENYSDQNRLFTISMFSPELRGAPLRSFTTKNAYLSTAIKETPALSPDISLSDPSTTAQTVVASNSVTLLPGFSANGNDGTFVAQIDQASANNDSGSLSDYITRTSYTYKTELLPNKVFVNVPTSVIVKDLLSGINTQQTFSYDTYYNVSKESSNYSGAGTKTTEVTYDNSTGSSYYIGRPLTKKTTLTGSGDVFTSEEQYTYSGSLPTQVKRKGHNTPFLTETMQYDGYGNVTSKTLATAAGGQRTTRMQYDATGRFMTKATDEEGMETHYQYDASTGNLLTKTDPYNLTSSYTYDEWGRLTQTTDYLNVKSYRTLQKSGSELIITETDDEGSEKITTVNALGKTMEVKSKDVLGQIVGKAYQYDIYDRPTGESEPATGGSYNQWNTTAYDEYGRIKQTTAFTGKTANISYNGLSVTVNDGTKSITTTKDALGNVISTQDPGGTISNTYFANGNLKSAGLDGSAQSIEQDGWGRKTKLTDPSAGVYTYAYNEFGEVTAETTPKGSTAYTYDANGKLQSKRVQGDYTDMGYQYTYDGASKVLTSLNLTNTDGNNAVYTYTYDGYKRPLGTVEDNVNARFSKTLTYDSYGRANTETLEARNKLNGRTASKTIVNIYQYGELKSISDNSTGQRIWEVDAINARGQVTAALLGTAIKESSSFDQYGMPQEIKTDRLGANAAELMRLGYSFDAQRGNLNSRSNTAFGWNESFNYDNLDRLTNFNDNSGNQSQSYDGRGRIASNSTLGNYAYTGNSYRQTGLNNVTSTAFNWYKARPLQQISYNAFKSPVEIAEQGKEKISFQYNAAEGRSAMYYGDEAADKMQRRYRKFYSEDGSMEITNDVQAGSTSFVFYLGGDAYTAPAIWKEEHSSSGTIQNLYFLHRDHLGSILMITDAQGAVKEKRQFDAWGNIVKLEDGNGNALTAFVILDRGYTGHEHLLGVALIHMNGRLYDPMLHRFLAPDNFVQDPSNTQNFNRYGYVMNNPLIYTDPSGEFIPVVFVVMGVAALLGGGGNVVSNWGNIVKNPWSAVGYFASGAVGGAVAVTQPWLGGSITALGNVATDVAFGNMPKFNGIGSVAKYIGGVALDGLGAAGAGSLSKWGFNTASQFGWVQNVGINGTAKVTGLGYETFSVLGPNVSVAATKVPVASLVKAAAGQAGEMSIKGGGTKLLGTARDNLLNAVTKNSKIYNMINDLYRPGASVGSGSTADFIRTVGDSGHIIKGTNYVKGLTKLLDSGTLNAGESHIAQYILNDLQDALKLIK